MIKVGVLFIAIFVAGAGVGEEAVAGEQSADVEQLSNISRRVEQDTLALNKQVGDSTGGSQFPSVLQYIYWHSASNVIGAMECKFNRSKFALTRVTASWSGTPWATR